MLKYTWWGKVALRPIPHHLMTLMSAQDAILLVFKIDVSRLK